MSLEDLTRLTVGDAAKAIADKRIKSRDIVEACLARIAARDPEIKAFVRLAADLRAQTARADAEPPRGPLHGVPVAVKDLIDTADMDTEYGSPIRRGFRPMRDANCVARLRAAGAIVIGKTATTEFAHTTPAATANPLDPQRTPGGSSSGSAAAVADFMVPAALGTQTGGSVIRPAAFCGLFGFKSSVGRTDVTGVHELVGSLDTVGWLTRSADDLALLGTVLLTPARAAAPLPPKLRIAQCRTPFDAAATQEARDAVSAAAARLREAGAEVLERALPPSFGDLNQVHRRLGSVEAARAFAPYEAENAELLSPALRGFIEEGRANAAGYAQSVAKAEARRKDLAALMRDIDAFLVIAAPGEAPVGLGSTGDATFSTFWSLLQVPCVTLPTSRGPSGMPIGVQLVGRRDRDEELLAVSCWTARALGL
jgi:amidase